jgi:ankyrin repeat protein
MEKSTTAPGQRRNFIRQTITLLVSAAALPAFAREPVFTGIPETGLRETGEKIPPLPIEMVSQFVGAAHGNIARVKEMLEKEPRLVNACVDQGGGDFETALGGASHMGNREIAQYLLQNGAREDIFHAAMSGKKELVASFVASYPAIVNIPGPHKLTLLYHVAISGDTRIADIIKPGISAINSDCNKALHAAVRSGRLEMTEWLVKNGADDLNTKDFRGNTPFQSAEKAGHIELAALLKKFGGK